MQGFTQKAPQKRVQEPPKSITDTLEQIQQFNFNNLSRRDDLGELLCFDAGLIDAQRLVYLYQRFPTTVLEDLPANVLNQIQKTAQDDLQTFQKILDFKPVGMPNPTRVRDSLLRELTEAYARSFNTLHPYISYAAAKSTDFTQLEREALATIHTILEEGKKSREENEKIREETKNVLTEVRRAAEEQGVSQQAEYFKENAERCETGARNWLRATGFFAICLAIYASASLFIHKIPILVPRNNFETAQLAVSKILVFTVLSYMVYLSARNYMAHRHNATINRHRQTALQTFRVLVEAAPTQNEKDVVLTHASACIFAPQQTGYARDVSLRSSGPTSFLGLILKSLGHSSE